MNKLKRFISAIMLCCMVLSLVPALNAGAVSYKDFARELDGNYSTRISPNSLMEYPNWDMLYFTPHNTGWYTFFSGVEGVLLHDICTYSGESLPNTGGYYNVFRDDGLHFFLEGGETYYLTFDLLDIDGAYIYVKPSAAFPELKEGSASTLQFDGTWSGVDGGAFAYKYLRFVPTKRGSYSFSGSYYFENWCLLDADGREIVADDYWNRIYDLSAGQTYYFGLTYDAFIDAVDSVDVSVEYTGSSTCTTHKYTSAGGDVCTVCGYVYEAELIPYSKTLYADENNAAVRDKPYAKAGKLVMKLAKRAKVEVTHYLYNSVGRKWYKTADGNYIFSERVTDKAPTTYTLSFEANGSGVSNLPSSVQILENTKYGIPGKFNDAPTRPGYSFLGYSTDKNASSAEYVPGNSIKVTKDTTLYAVWIEKASSLSDLPKEIVDKLNSTQGINQKLDKCTKCATATLLKRRQVAEGLNGTFTLEDIEVGAGYSSINPGSNVYKSNGSTYECTVIQPEKITGSRTELVLELLDKHPEGIVIYCNYRNLNKHKDSMHAIVLSDYETNSDGSYTIYAYDPSNGKTRIKFEETTLYKGCNSTAYKKYMKATEYPSYENVFSNFISGSCGCIWYVTTEE